MLGFYFSPYGRITRKQFWLQYVLVLIAIGIAASVGDYLLFPATREAGTGPISAVANLVTLWPQLALTTKRFHDRGMSGWWQLLFNAAIGLSAYFFYSATLEAEANNFEMTENLWAPLVGGIAVCLVAALVELVILGFLPGTKGSNKYGDDPLNPTKAVGEVFA